MSKISNESEFISLSAELFEELIQQIKMIITISELDDNNSKVWNRDDAILGGLLVRIIKLMQGFLNSFSENRIIINDIIARSLAESIINFLYLLENKSEDLYDEFIKYSLRKEKTLLNKINEQIQERGKELPIEVRMKKSINLSFEQSGFQIEDIEENNYSTWGGSIYNKFKELDLEELYFAIMGLKSHSIHGNWQDLLSNHLKYIDGAFKPNFENKNSRPQSILPMGYLIGDIVLKYIEDYVPKFEKSESVYNSIEYIVKKIWEVDKLHEEFLNES